MKWGYKKGPKCVAHVLLFRQCRCPRCPPHGNGVDLPSLSSPHGFTRSTSCAGCKGIQSMTEHERQYMQAAQTDLHSVTSSQFAKEGEGPPETTGDQT